MSTNHVRSLAVHRAVAGVAALLLLAACGSSSDDGGSPAETGSTGSTTASRTATATGGVDPTIQAMLPASIREAGKLNVGITTTLAPYNYVDADGNYVGLSVDLGTAVAEMMGLTLEYTSTNQALLITGIQSAKFDVGTIAFADTGPEAQAELTFIDYLNRSVRLLVQKGNPEDITSVDQFCDGNDSIAVGTSAAQAPWLEEQSAACVAAGKQAIKISKYANGAEVTQAVVSGRDDAALLDTLSGAYTAEQGGNLEEVGPTYLTVLSGWAVDPKSTELAAALQAALQKLVDNGTYAELLTKYGAPDAMKVSEILVNGGSAS